MDIKRETVIAEKEDDGWLVMWPDGKVNFYFTKRQVLAAVKARLGKADAMVTRLEWRS